MTWTCHLIGESFMSASWVSSLVCSQVVSFIPAMYAVPVVELVEEMHSKTSTALLASTLSFISRTEFVWTTGVGTDLVCANAWGAACKLWMRLGLKTGLHNRIDKVEVFAIMGWTFFLK